MWVRNKVSKESSCCMESPFKDLVVVVHIMSSDLFSLSPCNDVEVCPLMN